jgi:5-methylcytosine-specific restriction endonuclease McrA
LLFDFTTHRYAFEEFLVHHRHYINQLAKSKGSRTRPVDSLVALYESVYREVKNNQEHSQIVAVLRSDERLRDLEDIRDEERPRKKFSKQVRSAAFLKTAVESPVRCAICKARMRSKSMSADHINRIQDGGVGNVENLQWTHPYCNTGYKEKQNANERAAEQQPQD